MPEWTIEFYADQNGREPCREWMEKLGRVERDANTSGRKVILLLSGYDKLRDASRKRQDTEIRHARKLLTACQEAQKRSRKLTR